MRKPTRSAIAIALYLAACVIAALFGWTQRKPARADDRYVLCVTGSGPACDSSAEYTKAACEALPQMSGWADGTNPFYCKQASAAAPSANCIHPVNTPAGFACLDAVWGIEGH
jgi:hypothetical protein